MSAGVEVERDLSVRRQTEIGREAEVKHERVFKRDEIGGAELEVLEAAL